MIRSTPLARAASWSACSVSGAAAFGSARAASRRTPGEQLDQDLLALAIEFGAQQADPGGVAAGTCHGLNEAFADHVFGDGENGDRRRRLLHHANGGTRAAEDDIDLGL